MNDDIGDRMKRYEDATGRILVPRMPFVIRIDGKAFHTFTKGYQKPYDINLSNAFVMSMQFLCREVQSCIIGYTQSDEISIACLPYQSLNSQPWFGGHTFKICSVAASIITHRFNEMLNWNGAEFDARVFNVPESDLANYFYWRYKDCVRNSINAAGYKYFSASKLHGKSCNDIKDMIRKINFPWEDNHTDFKNGILISYDSDWASIQGFDIRDIVNTEIKSYLLEGTAGEPQETT
jgi:tRNA(His) 5'-end guanylyltransferase